MLTNLFGSKSAERILLFLFVNECSYASEVQRAHGIALTPLQNILQKFEKAGVLLGEAHRKTKLYRFNPAYPLLDELKALLKKAFIHLPPEEKRALFARKNQWRGDEYAQQKRIALCLDAFWQRLKNVQRVSIQTQEEDRAYGEVRVGVEKADALLFTENGHWTQCTKQGIEFSNCLRWSLDRAAGMVALEHLRYGPHRPVFLFHLAPTGPNTLQSIDSHLCADDCYFGRIEFTRQHIRLIWRIIGRRKNEILHHIYS